MRKIFLFMMVSLDGFFEGPDHDLSWHNTDEEFNRFAIDQLNEADTILFGRKTYQLMANFWPSEQGLKDDPLVAKEMNFTPKIVVSNSLEKVEEGPNWKNVSLINDNLAQKLRKLKNNKGRDIVVLASNNLCITLLSLGLIDEVRIMINPVAIGKGTPLFYGIKEKINFKLFKTRKFKNGNILLSYQPTKRR